ATLLVGTWTKEIDKGRVREVLAGRAPFDYGRLDKAAADGPDGHQGGEPQDTAEAPAEVPAEVPGDGPTGKPAKTAR
ncbi:C4-dicarboxylate transporter DctA, partial [Streptomyces sp. LD120]|nr:C4-dicarboxylate transporter DctA [Streptomyces physcomitrii]